MIIITGAAGFIGSNLVSNFNKTGQDDLILVDDVNNSLKKQNLINLHYNEIVGINEFWNWIRKNKSYRIDAIFHLGACSDTLEKNKDYLCLLFLHLRDYLDIM